MDEVSVVANIWDMEDDIELFIQEFCEKEGIEDMRKADPLVWTACMTQIGRRFFKETQYFRDMTMRDGAIMPTTDGTRHDLNKINQAVDFYIYLCRKYGKPALLDGHCQFMGIDRQYFNRVAGDVVRKSEIRRKIYLASEDTVTEGGFGSKIPQVMAMAYLNHKHRWTEPLNAPELQEERKGTLAPPDLSGMIEQKDN